MEQRTHLAADAELCGEPTRIEEGEASVRLRTGPRMAVDDRGLVHGGFVFGLADYAAMLAVNEPNVVLGRAEVRFLRPVVVGEELSATATVVETEGGERRVRVEVLRERDQVFGGEFLCRVPSSHLLE